MIVHLDFRAWPLYNNSKETEKILSRISAACRQKKERILMPEFSTMLSLQAQMMLLLACGIIMTKKGIINEQGRACLTDLLDGYIARHYNQVSDFGKFMDPLADKCLVMAALCWFVEEGTFFAWVLAIVLLREFAVSGMRLVAVEKGRVIAAGWSGKIKTASTMVCICLILLGIPQVLNYVCQGIILLTTVYSGIEYFAKNADVFKEVK